ncbi:MAG TPA: molecular chaperone Hsp90 [Candidatus Mediterraneibacter merdipullorum]|nr:molecular chaperone Hsp90 [Candidatus Mediterraneibacter merdipullorum]
MKKEIRDYVVEKTHEMMNAFSCSAEAKAAGQAWLDALGTDRETRETEKYIAELEGDIMPVDMLIAFAESDGGAQVFGAEKTKEVAAHAKEIKAAGAKYCDCPACAAVEAILAKKEEMLG